MIETNIDKHDNNKNCICLQIPGGPADLDGQLQRGDLLHSVDGKDVSTADHETAAAACKAVGAKVNIKVKRFKIVR